MQRQLNLPHDFSSLISSRTLRSLKINTDGIEGRTRLDDKIKTINEHLDTIREHKGLLIVAVNKLKLTTNVIIRTYQVYDVNQAYIYAIIASSASALMLAKNIVDTQVRARVTKELYTLQSEATKFAEDIRRFMLWAESVIPGKFLAQNIWIQRSYKPAGLSL